MVDVCKIDRQRFERGSFFVKGVTIADVDVPQFVISQMNSVQSLHCG